MHAVGENPNKKSSEASRRDAHAGDQRQRPKKTQNQTEADIQQQLKAENSTEAKQLADVFLLANPDSRAIRDIYAPIVAGLADEGYRKTKGMLDKRMFDRLVFSSTWNTAQAFLWFIEAGDCESARLASNGAIGPFPDS